MAFAPPSALTAAQVHEAWRSIPSKIHDRALRAWAACAVAAGAPPAAARSSLQRANAILSACAGVQNIVPGFSTPGEVSLLIFELEIERLGIKGMPLSYSRNLGPSRYEQKSYRMRRCIDRAQRLDNPKLVNKWRMALEKLEITPFEFDFLQDQV